jgi:hypothetical protein
LVTRREFLDAAGVFLCLGGAARPALANDARHRVLENDALRLSFGVGPQGVTARSFENRLTGERTTLPTAEFLLEFDDGAKVSSQQLTGKLQAADAGLMEWRYTGPAGLEVRVEYRLAPRARYVRKRISLRVPRGPQRRLVVAELEDWQGVPRRWATCQADRFPYGSHPVYCDTLWAGVEFVVAFNQVGPEGFTLRSRPGRRPIGAEWVELHSTVLGVARPGGVRDAFFRYLDDIRLAPARMVACYNSWWTLPKVVKQRDNLALIRELKGALFDRHGVFFDIITTDMGWSNPRSIWEIDRSILPQGFDDIRAIVEPAGGKLGVWMSPSEIYPPVCDYDWAEQAGYTVLRPERESRSGQKRVCSVPGLSLADPKYREQTKRQLQRLIRENGLAHIKYDGFWAVEQHAHHDLAPGDDSVEPLAEHSLELLAASKAANPQLVTEPTYMNSIANYISPWILKHSDTVWANGEDCVVGVGPAPDYRESHTNAREFMVFQALDQVWLPQNAVHYFDIVHVDSAEGFANHAAMAVGRGRFFLSTYLNPKLMNADDWRVYAGLLRWARGNVDLLRNTVVVPSRVELGEPYAYGHWRGQRGVVAVRNPSNESTDYVLDLAQAGAPRELADALCYTQYPYRRGIAAGLTGRGQVPLRLAPWEVLFLEVVPRSELQETVAVGARWDRAAGETLSIVPDQGVDRVRVFEPGAAERQVRVAPRQEAKLSGALMTRTVGPLAKGEWLQAKSRTHPLFPFRYPATPNAETLAGLRETEWKNVKWRDVPSTSFAMECSVSIPAAPGKVLLLVEFPGREHRPSRCQAWVDGRPARLEPRDSTEHIGYYNWTGALRPFESEWTWYLCDVGAGVHCVKFEGAAGHPSPRLGLWVWTDQDLAVCKQPILVRGSEAAMPQYREWIERMGICLLKPAAP